jgi:hypothetical protein
MPFAYYARLKPRQQAIYRASEAIAEVELPRGAALEPLALALERAF